MIYYAAAMTVTLILSHFNTTINSLSNGVEAKRYRNAKIAFIVLLPLTFLAVFRWNVGVDSLYKSSYWYAYHAAAYGINSRGFEFGFYWFMRLFAELEIPFFWFLFVHALMFMMGVSYAISRGTVWTTWSILVFFLLFFYFDCYSSLRQSLAEAICLIAWADMGFKPPTKKKDTQILLLFLAAALFHKIALINIPIYLLCKIRFGRIGLLKCFIVAVIATPILQVMLRFVMELIAGDNYTYQGVARINTVMTGILAAICWYFYNQISSLDENAYMYVNLALCIFILFLNSGAMYLPFRVFDILKIGYVFIIPYLLRGIRNKRIRLYMESFILLIFGAWFFNQFVLQNSFAANYQTAFANWDTISHLP